MTILRGEALTLDSDQVAEDLALLRSCWVKIGLRAAMVEWRMEQPVKLTASLATRLRSALGPALAEALNNSPTLQMIPGSQRPPAAWFVGWDCPPQPIERFRAELRCVGAVAPDWPELSRALTRMRLPDTSGGLSGTRKCVVSWLGDDIGAAECFGPPLVADPDLTLGGGACLVEAITPLHLRASGREIREAPPLAVIVRSAGERLRQLVEHWGGGVPGLPSVIGRAYREAEQARLSWSRLERRGEMVRTSASTGQRQLIGGLRGLFAYGGVTPLAMTVVALGAELGIGKGTAFGCGQIRLHGIAGG